MRFLLDAFNHLAAGDLESTGRRIERLPTSLYLYCMTGLFILAGACLGAHAQVKEQASTPVVSEAVHLGANATHIEQVQQVPGVGSWLRGLNAGLTISGVHDSLIGWYTVATPAVSYTFSRHFSFDASVSIYPFRRVQSQSSFETSSFGEIPSLEMVMETGETGDTFVGFHARFDHRLVRNTVTAYFTLPTGDRSNGLGTGKVTYDFSDHMEHSIRRTNLLFDIGAGDSSGLFNNLVTKDYSSVGPLVHFQTGMAIWLPGSNYVQAVAYDQLPFGKQTVYSSVGPLGMINATVVSGEKAGQDDGITASWGIPLTDHLTMSGYYSRSFRQQLNTVSTGVTYVLRGTPRKKRLSMIDKALREAEETGQ
jgi:hypothetical protein